MHKVHQTHGLPYFSNEGLTSCLTNRLTSNCACFEERAFRHILNACPLTPNTIWGGAKRQASWLATLLPPLDVLSRRRTLLLAFLRSQVPTLFETTLRSLQVPLKYLQKRCRNIVHDTYTLRFPHASGTGILRQEIVRAKHRAYDGGLPSMSRQIGIPLLPLHSFLSPCSDRRHSHPRKL